METTAVEVAKATSIAFPFSEAPHLPTGPFLGDRCWEMAGSVLALAPRPELGYYKTDFVITYNDGETYQGRYDIGDDSPTLGQHIRDFVQGVIEGGYDDETKDSYVDFVATHEVR